MIAQSQVMQKTCSIVLLKGISIENVKKMEKLHVTRLGKTHIFPVKIYCQLTTEMFGIAVSCCVHFHVVHLRRLETYPVFCRLTRISLDLSL